MNQKQVKYMLTNPNAMMDFQLRGKLPKERKAPSTPLRELIESIPRAYWSQFQMITLSPKLGFIRPVQFTNLAYLYQWLGGNKTLIANQTLPYLSHRNARFYSVISIETLAAHCKQVPELSHLKSRR